MESPHLHPESPQHRARTKIVATVGPACQEKQQLAEMIAAGVDVFRINTAHGETDEHAQVLATIRELEAEVGRPLGVLVDLAGPKIRLGELAEEPLVCRHGDTFTLVRGQQATIRDHLVSNYPKLIDELEVGDRVLLADGTVAMAVVQRTPDSAVLEVTDGGMLRSRQGINLPGVRLSVQAPTDRDLEFANWAIENDVDFLGLSFVRYAGEVWRLKHVIADKTGSSGGIDGKGPLVIAKIEKVEAIANLTEIVQAADGVMVARGDLGVEMDVAHIAAMQKEIIDTCTLHHKPVIVATQMLESMRHSPRPTRAEATDVANAILDGADACMLSGETAIGDHPAEVVEMMNRIALATEPLTAGRRREQPTKLDGFAARPVTVALVHAAGQLAQILEAKMVVVASRSGATAIAKAKQREFIRTVGVSDNRRALRRFCLMWGVTPLADAPLKEIGKLADYVEHWGKTEGTLSAGDRVIVVGGTGLLEITHNQIVVHEVM